MWNFSGGGPPDPLPAFGFGDHQFLLISNTDMDYADSKLSRWS